MQLEQKDQIVSALQGQVIQSVDIDGEEPMNGDAGTITLYLSNGITLYADFPTVYNAQ